MKTLANSLSLYFISFIFIFISITYLRYEITLEIIFSMAYLSCWFYYGYKLSEGFLNGIKIGGIAAGIGIILSLGASILNYEYIVWIAPLTGIIRFIPENTNYYSIVIGAFVVVSILTALGSQVGLKKNQKDIDVP